MSLKYEPQIRALIIPGAMLWLDRAEKKVLEREGEREREREKRAGRGGRDAGVPVMHYSGVVEWGACSSSERGRESERERESDIET